jgi:hypothetical protein
MSLFVNACIFVMCWHFRYEIYLKAEQKQMMKAATPVKEFGTHTRTTRQTGDQQAQ